MTQSILVAGGTGMLGGQIVAALLDQPGARVRMIVREGSDRALIEALLARGSELVVADLADPASLNRATQGVDVIVSALQGGPDVIVEGQVALAKAGKANGARRILPSDYALDLFKATPGEHAMFDMRAEADRRIAEIGLEQVNVLQGAFMDMFLPGHGAIDLDAGTIGFFGDGERKLEVTTVEDTALMVARVALDRDIAPGKFAFAGDLVTFRKAGEIVARATGRPIKASSMGSEADLRAMMGKAPPERRVMLAYLLYMMTGQTALSDLQNDRYSDIRFEGFADFIARKLLVAAHA